MQVSREIVDNSTQAPEWRKSTSSTVECVEIADLGGMAGVRDSKSPSGPQLRFSFGEWADFLVGVKSGEFDLRRLPD